MEVCHVYIKLTFVVRSYLSHVTCLLTSCRGIQSRDLLVFAFMPSLRCCDVDQPQLSAFKITVTFIHLTKPFDFVLVPLTLFSFVLLVTRYKVIIWTCFASVRLSENKFHCFMRYRHNICQLSYDLSVVISSAGCHIVCQLSYRLPNADNAIVFYRLKYPRKRLSTVFRLINCHLRCLFPVCTEKLKFV